MRHISFAMGILAICASDAVGQQVFHARYQNRQRAGCDAPYDCGKPLNCEEPLGAGEPDGYFAAPPQDGTVAGGSTAYGINGPALHFPALTLKLPTLQLPSLVKMRTNPRMLMGPSTAPYVRRPTTAFGMPYAVKRVDPPAGAGGGKSAQQKGAPTQHGAANWELQHRLEMRDQQIASLQQQVSRLADSIEVLARATAARQQPAAAPVRGPVVQAEPISPQASSQSWPSTKTTTAHIAAYPTTHPNLRRLPRVDAPARWPRVPGEASLRSAREVARR